MSNRSRSALALCVPFASWLVAAHAASPLVDVQSVATRTSVSAQSFADLPVNCPAGYNALSGFVTPSAPKSVQVLGSWGLRGSDPSPLVDGFHMSPTGMNFTVQNPTPEEVVADARVICGRYQAGFGQSSLGVVNHVVAAGERRTVNASCRPGEIATGGGYEWRGGPIVWNAPWNLSPGGGGYGSVPDDIHSAPGGWEFNVVNLSGSARNISVSAFCHANPEARTVVVSAYLDPGQYRFVGAAIDYDLRILGNGLDGGQEGRMYASAGWDSGFGANFTHDPFEIPVPGGGFAGSFVGDLRAPGTMGMQQLVRVGLVVENYGLPPPATQLVDVDEWRHEGTGFYFSTAIPGEKRDLDLGLRGSWKRTGESYKAYATGSGGPVGRQPWSRFFNADLGSHFYGGSVFETHAVRWGFGGAWQIESGEVYQLPLPNTQTGECPAGFDSLFRTYNQLGNHRLTSNRAARDYSINVENHRPEGYGPLGVAGCAPRLSFAP